jgi:hypothetical protein
MDEGRCRRRRRFCTVAASTSNGDAAAAESSSAAAPTEGGGGDGDAPAYLVINFYHLVDIPDTKEVRAAGRAGRVPLA